MTDQTMEPALVLAAANFAAQKHSTQRRKDPDSSPYINHPIEVAHLLSNVAGVRDPVVLCAALLHDTVEDTDTTIEEIEAKFGPHIASVVAELTDDKALKKAARKQHQIDAAAGASSAAKLVKLADKTSNLLDMGNAWPAGWDRDRVVEYFDWADAVVARLGHVNEPLAARYRAAAAQRPARTADA